MNFTRPTQRCMNDLLSGLDMTYQIFNDTERRAASLRQLNFLSINRNRLKWISSVFTRCELSE